MSGGQEERKRILVLTYIETFSAGNAVTPVYLEMFFGRVEFILKSPSVFVGRFGAVGKTHKVHPVHFEEIGCQGLHVQSAGNADTEVSATYQFFGDDVDRCAADITAAACVEGFVDTYGLYDVRSEKVERDILIFRVFGRKGEAVEGGCIIAVAQSADKDVLHSVLFRYS